MSGEMVGRMVGRTVGPIILARQDGTVGPIILYMQGDREASQDDFPVWGHHPALCYSMIMGFRRRPQQGIAARS